MARAKYGNKICRIGSYGKDAFTFVPIVVIGAGESGIALGCQLKEKLGFDQFRIYDRQAGIGGTWWINRYPGVACDVPAVFYSFSFANNPYWSEWHPSGQEISKYFADVCNKYGITDKVQVNTDVEGCTWMEQDKCWEVRLRHMFPGTGDLSVKDRNERIQQHGVESVYIGHETIRARIVVSAVGGLVEPNPFPNIDGKDSFKGEIFHSARWRHDIDFNDKNVVVIGTGCSAAQVVPNLIKPPYNAKSIVQLMREPPWVVRRFEAPGGDESWSKNGPTLMQNVPGLQQLIRKIAFCRAEYDFRLFGGDEYHANERKKVEDSMIRYMKKRVPPEYYEMLTPNYSIGCKRRIFDPGWYDSLRDPRIDLTTQPLTLIKESSVILGPGQYYPKKSADAAPETREVPADVIVLCNGFETQKWLHPLQVSGRGGVDLVQEMERRGGAQAYQGTAMDGFPNFLMLVGPNTVTGHSSVILASENMIIYSLKFIEKVLNGDAETFEVKRKAEEAYTADIQKASKKLVSNNGGCHNWYTHDGWNSSLLPYSQIWFGLRCFFPRWQDWDIVYTPKGLLKRRTVRTIRMLLMTASIILGVKTWRSGQGLLYLNNLIRQLVDQIPSIGRRALEAVRLQR